MLWTRWYLCCVIPMYDAADMSGHTYKHTYIHTYIHTYTQDNYNNSCCACAPRVNKYIARTLWRVWLHLRLQARVAYFFTIIQLHTPTHKHTHSHTQRCNQAHNDAPKHTHTHTHTHTQHFSGEEIEWTLYSIMCSCILEPRYHITSHTHAMLGPTTSTSSQPACPPSHIRLPWAPWALQLSRERHAHLRAKTDH